VRLTLIHQLPGASPLPAGARLWRTCLRDVVFITEPADTGTACGVLEDADAYALLVEVVCGLRSPLAGETEVQAQFKAFLAALDPVADRELRRLGERVLADAKRVRHAYLQGVAVHAYGPLVADVVPAGRHVVLVGTGALATAVREHLGDRHGIHQWGRRPAEGRPGYAQLGGAAADTLRSADLATLVVAAAVLQPDLALVLRAYPRIVEVVDLRAGHERTPLATDARTITLDDLFDRARLPAGAARRIADARREILNLGRAFGRREELHPFGWDDVCA
jgi:glutamyl-tRNA reductase